jgi:hypothetical protein
MSAPTPTPEDDRPATPARPRWPGRARLPGLPERRRTGRWLARLLFEAALITFSVTLALAANAWREERAERARLDEARAAFAEELRHNRDLLREPAYHPYHRGMHDLYAALSRAGTDAERAPLERRLAADFNTGLHPTPLRDAVWRSLSAGSLFERMDYGELVLLADIYREQESLDAMFRAMFAAWMTPRADRDDPAYRRDDLDVTRMFLNDVISAEARLLDRYDEALALLDGPAR